MEWCTSFDEVHPTIPFPHTVSTYFNNLLTIFTFDNLLAVKACEQTDNNCKAYHKLEEIMAEHWFTKCITIPSKLHHINFVGTQTNKHQTFHF